MFAVPSVHQIPTASEHLDGFLFRHNDLVECFSAFKSIISDVVEADGISGKFLTIASTYLLSCVACFQSCNHLFCFSSI
jgi:hypothetical protein